MDTIGIIPNTHKDKDLYYTKQLYDWLTIRGFNVITTSLISRKLTNVVSELTISKVFENSKFVIVLGGDGTILRTAKYAAIADTPILGINLGTLGFLTDCEITDCYESLQKVLDNDYMLEKRMMLQALIERTDIENETLLALNDICVTRNFSGGVISIELYVNDMFVDNYKADGLIVSTPTGSTAYNLSAGGPILKPDGRMIVVTPICSHMLHSRSFVFSDKDFVKIKLIDKRNMDVAFSVDGKNIASLTNSDYFEVVASKLETSIIKTKTRGFYDIIKEKMIKTELI